jgi:hypothetical protein
MMRLVSDAKKYGYFFQLIHKPVRNKNKDLCLAGFLQIKSTQTPSFSTRTSLFRRLLTGYKPDQFVTDFVENHCHSTKSLYKNYLTFPPLLLFTTTMEKDVNSSHRGFLYCHLIKVTMARKIMINSLELAFCPVSNNDFAFIKDDEGFQNHAHQSTVYMIAQRKELTIENLDLYFIAPYQTILRFEVRQKGNPSVLKCQMPIYQENIASDPEKEIKFRFEYAYPKPDPMPQGFPQGNIRNLLLFYQDEAFICWISAENFIQNYLNGAIEAVIEGPVDDFLNYKVHYVGKATEQEVWRRLTGHSTLQDILSIEYPLHYGSLPTHEIALLFFKVKDGIGLHSISTHDEITQDVINSVLGNNQPSQRTISVDAEKALINAMQPKYNKTFYKNYPRSTDGLFSYDLDGYYYQIRSHIILQYNDGIITGRPGLDADSIVIIKDHSLKVYNR